MIHLLAETATPIPWSNAACIIALFAFLALVAIVWIKN